MGCSRHWLRNSPSRYNSPGIHNHYPIPQFAEKVLVRSSRCKNCVPFRDHAPRRSNTAVSLLFLFCRPASSRSCTVQCSTQCRPIGGVTATVHKCTILAYALSRGAKIAVLPKFHYISFTYSSEHARRDENSYCEDRLFFCGT